MRIEDLLEIAEYINDSVHYYVPYCANRPKEGLRHREFWLNVMRSGNDRFNSKEKIRQWHLDLQAENVDEDFMNKKVAASIPGIINPHPSLKEWEEYFINLPNCAYTKQRHKNGYHYTPHERVESTAKHGMRYGTGNCGEQSALAYILLQDYPKNGLFGLPKIDSYIMIERLRIVGKGDHGFIVINRDPNSDLNSIETWGKDTVILDPWLDDVVWLGHELKRFESDSFCFDYLTVYQADIRNQDPIGHISQGLTHHWQTKRDQKNEPRHVNQWLPFFNRSIDNKIINEEKVPWAQSPTSTNENTSLRKMKK